MKSSSTPQIARTLAKQGKGRLSPSLGIPSENLREYPNRPVLAVGGVVVKDGLVLLIRRGHPPSRGEWSLPGGMVELGERVCDAVRRELKEETGLNVKPVALAAVFERVIRQRGRGRFHYRVLDYACRLRGGWLCHGSDVIDARWGRREDLKRYHLRRPARAVIRQSFEILKAWPDNGEARVKLQERTDRAIQIGGNASLPPASALRRHVLGR